jgi:lantibiotic modifying enzyme
MAQEASVGIGAAGIALFFSYLSQTRPAGGYDRLAEAFLTRATTAVSDVSMKPDLYGGFSGIAWVVSHLDRRWSNPQEDDPLEAIDPVLLDYLDRSPWLDSYDLISGLVGYGVYAVERLPRPSAVTCLQRVIAHLAESAEHTAEGITWFTRPELLPPQQRELAPQGYYNLGLAHGVPGVIALLAAACAAGVATAQAKELLTGAVTWLLAQQLPRGFPSRFPMLTFAGSQPGPSRLAWCYGDAGIMGALLYAARCANEPDWEQFALEMSIQATERDPETTGVVDAPLCHGAMGLAHVFNRLYQATGATRLAEAARLWCQRALSLRRPGKGIAGFVSYENDQWVGRPGFLTGVSGIALALLGLTTPIEPQWDRLLLVAIPPQAARGKR